ncbi:MAG: hypothetical protein ACT4NJ_08005 [Nitrosopumilaceae archaeon]
MQILDLDNVSTSQNQGALLTGNVKVTQFDGDGNIIAYRQSDNHIVRSGMEIIMAQVFGDMNSTSKMPNLDSSLVHPVRYMQIGTDGERRLLHNDTSIQAPIAGCVRQLATITNSSAQGAHGAPAGCNDIGTLCSAQMNVTATASFLGTASCNVASIDEAGIFDNSTTDTTAGDAPGNGGGLMFARNTFGSVTLNMLDTLQLDWEFTFTDS